MALLIASGMVTIGAFGSFVTEGLGGEAWAGPGRASQIRRRRKKGIGVQCSPGVYSGGSHRRKSVHASLLGKREKS